MLPDVTLPPLDPPTGTPPTNQGGSPLDEVVEEDAEVEALSPQALLAKRPMVQVSASAISQPPPASPVPVQAVVVPASPVAPVTAPEPVLTPDPVVQASPLSEPVTAVVPATPATSTAPDTAAADLLKHAAEPAAPLILPTPAAEPLQRTGAAGEFREVAAGSDIPIELPKKRAEDELLPPAEPLKEEEGALPIQIGPAAVPPPGAEEKVGLMTLPGSAAAALPVPPPPPAPTGKIGMSTTPAVQSLTPTRPHRTSPLLLAGAGVLLLALMGGGLYALALSGVRVPVVGKFVSGLEGPATAASQRSLAWVQAQEPQGYIFDGTTAVKLRSADGGSGSEITELKSIIQEGLVSDQGGRFSLAQEITANTGTGVPVALRTTGAGYVVQFPKNIDTKTASVAVPDLADTLLQPLISPVPVETTLGAVRAEKAYRKVVVSGSQPAAEYSVDLDPAALASYFPKGSSLSAASARLTLAWGGGQLVAGTPLIVDLGVVFTYNEKEYDYQASQAFTSWATVSPVNSTLSALASVDPARITNELTAESFLARLGITPSLLPSGSTPSDTPTPTPTPSPSAFTPIVPSGLSVTSVQTAVGSGQPVAVQPVSDAAKQRDIQRKKDLGDLQKAVEQYKLEKGSYPVVTGQVEFAANATLFSALVGPYLTAMPVDPLKDLYFYGYNVVKDSSGAVTGYSIRSVLENHSDADAKVGITYHYYELTAQ